MVRWHSIASAVLVTVLALYLFASFAGHSRLLAWQSLPGADKSPISQVTPQPLPKNVKTGKHALPKSQPVKPTAPPSITYTGKDIVLVTGSDGHHSLQTHSDDIRENREDYARQHGIVSPISFNC